MEQGIVGRDADLVAVERFLDRVAEATGALVLEGEPGIGKTTIWREALARASRREFRVLVARPAEAEATPTPAWRISSARRTTPCAKTCPPGSGRPSTWCCCRRTSKGVQTRARPRWRSSPSSARLPPTVRSPWRSTTCSGSTAPPSGRSSSPHAGCPRGSALSRRSGPMASATCRWASRERYSTGRSSAWCSARYRFRRSTTSAAATSGDGAFAPVARTHRVGFGGNSFYSLDIARMLARGGQELAPAAYSGQPPGYGQGLRLIDASDARNLRQVGYYDVTGTDPATNPSSLSWDVALRGDLIYLFELSGGIEILRLAGGPTASARLPTVREPAGRSDPLAARPVAGLTRGSLVCPVS